MLLKELLRSVSLYRRTLPHRYLFVACIKFHNKENRPKTDGICVANHTSPIDVVILSVDRPYALVGQSHGGMMGLIQGSLSKGAAHIWFQRSETKDRSTVTRR